MKQAPFKRAGFTLVEVIVTLVVLGILAGIGVPAMTGWIDDSKEKACMANRKSIEEDYAAYRALNRISKAGGDDGFAAFLSAGGSLGQEPACPSGGNYSMHNGAIQCDKHPSAGLAYAQGGDTPEQILRAAMAGSLAGFTNASVIDSTGADGMLGKDQSARAKAMVDWLNNQQNSAWASLNVLDWKLQMDGKNQIKFATWTDQNVAETTLGAYVRVVRYEAAKAGSPGAYTVGYLKVEEKTANSSTYNTLIDASVAKNWYGCTDKTDTRQKFASYEEAVEAFNKLNLSAP